MTGSRKPRVLCLDDEPHVLDRCATRCVAARLLSLAREHAPDTVRVMLTGHAALPDAAAAINDGEICRLLIKPCKTDELTAALNFAVAHRAAQRHGREALDEALGATIRAVVALAAHTNPGGPSRAEQVGRHAAELAGRMEDVEFDWSSSRRAR